MLMKMAPLPVIQRIEVQKVLKFKKQRIEVQETLDLIQQYNIISIVACPKVSLLSNRMKTLRFPTKFWLL